MVVAPVGPSRSVVTALSPEAWEAGIRKGMMVAKALRYCRGVVVLPPNEPLYARASRAICKILNDFSPVLEPAGYGHAYLDITGTAPAVRPAARHGLARAEGDPAAAASGCLVGCGCQQDGEPDRFGGDEAGRAAGCAARR